MIIATHGIVASQLAGFDADAQAFFNRVTTAGGSLSNTEKTAVNQLVLDMKSYSIWSKMKAIYPMVGASSAACAQNLVSSSFTGTFSSGWTFASTGITPNGTSAYMDTTIAPSSNLTSGNTHASVYLRTNTAAGVKQELGSIDTLTSGGEYSIITKFTGNLAYPIIASFSNTFFPTYSNTNSQGFWVVNRENTTNIQYYNRSTKVVDSTQTNGMSTRNIYVGARNNVGSADRFSDRENAFVSIGDGLTNTQASNFYTAVQAFQTTLSRQV